MEKFYAQYCGAKQGSWYENHGSHIVQFKKNGLFSVEEVFRIPLHNNMEILEIFSGESGFVRVLLKDRNQKHTFYIYQRAEDFAHEIRINNS